MSGLFWGTHEGSYFPFTSWILFAAFGYFFADFLQQTNDKKRLYSRISPVGAIIFVALSAVLVNFHEWDAMMDGPTYYHQDITMNLMYVAFVVGWLGFCYLMASIIPDSLTNILKTFSANVTVIYVIQYILIIYVQVLITDETVFTAPVVLGITTV